MEKSKEELRGFIVSTLSDMLGSSPNEIALDANFDQLGVSSSSAIGLIGELEEYLDIDITPSVLYEHNTVASLSAYFSK